MDDVTRVEWREWGDAAFDEAREADSPVLLSLTATWCDHCHEMDAETYAVPTIAATVADGFVPVRVDADRHPRVRDRYTMGGFPSTVFLTPDGSILTGAGYLGQDGMRQVLERVRTMWESNGADAGRVPRPLREDDVPAGELSPDVETQMLGQLTEHYDDVAGGWDVATGAQSGADHAGGDGPKFPLPDALEFALKRDREMALRSFDAVSANLFDEYDGGFYRFATERDWSGLHREKLLDANAALVRAFANAYLTSGREEYRMPAERTIEYLTTTLWTDDADAFAASQAPGDPASYTLEASDREAAADPPIDETVFAGANALAIDALLTYAAYTDDERARRYAERALETVRERLLDDGVVIHYRDERTGDDEPTRDRPSEGEDESEGERCLLADQARVLGALTTAHSVLGAPVLEEAKTVADVTVDRLRDGDSFVDGPRSGPGLLERSLRPLDGNVDVADAVLELAVLTGEDRYRELARETLEAFASASDRFGVQVARYASVASRLCEDPLVVRVGSESGSDLHRAAFRLADHEKIVVPDDSTVSAGEARVERGGQVSEPASTPEALAARISSILE